MTFFEGIAGRINSMIHTKDPSLTKLNGIVSRFHLKNKIPTQKEIAYLIGVCNKEDKGLKTKKMAKLAKGTDPSLSSVKIAANMLSEVLSSGKSGKAILDYVRTELDKGKTLPLALTTMIWEHQCKKCDVDEIGLRCLNQAIVDPNERLEDPSIVVGKLADKARKSDAKAGLSLMRIAAYTLDNIVEMTEIAKNKLQDLARFSPELAEKYAQNYFEEIGETDIQTKHAWKTFASRFGIEQKVNTEPKIEDNNKINPEIAPKIYSEIESFSEVDFGLISKLPVEVSEKKEDIEVISDYSNINFIEPEIQNNNLPTARDLRQGDKAAVRWMVEQALSSKSEERTNALMLLRENYRYVRHLLPELTPLLVKLQDVDPDPSLLLMFLANDRKNKDLYQLTANCLSSKDLDLGGISPRSLIDKYILKDDSVLPRDFVDRALSNTGKEFILQRVQVGEWHSLNNSILDFSKSGRRSMILFLESSHGPTYLLLSKDDNSNISGSIFDPYSHSKDDKKPEEYWKTLAGRVSGRLIDGIKVSIQYEHRPISEIGKYKQEDGVEKPYEQVEHRDLLGVYLADMLERKTVEERIIFDEGSEILEEFCGEFEDLPDDERLQRFRDQRIELLIDSLA